MYDGGTVSSAHGACGYPQTLIWTLGWGLEELVLHHPSLVFWFVLSLSSSVLSDLFGEQTIYDQQRWLLSAV